MKSNNSQPVTKKDLEDALKNYPTKTDLKDALKNYPTKTDLKDALKNYPTKTDLANALKNYPTKTDLANSFKKYRDDILTKIDEVMGELQTMREENTIGTYQTRELKEQVDDHEKRILKLETP